MKKLFRKRWQVYVIFRRHGEILQEEPSMKFFLHRSAERFAKRVEGDSGMRNQNLEAIAEGKSPIMVDCEVREATP